MGCCQHVGRGPDHSSRRRLVHLWRPPEHSDNRGVGKLVSTSRTSNSLPNPGGRLWLTVLRHQNRTDCDNTSRGLGGGTWMMPIVPPRMSSPARSLADVSPVWAASPPTTLSIWSGVRATGASRVGS